MSDSAYRGNEGRLADVISAIQTLGTYKYYKLDFAGWADRISGTEANASHWQHIFEQHPEFFRLDSERLKASLVWRRQHQKLYDVDQECKISRPEYEALGELEKERVSRTPLSSSELEMLIETAIKLHSQALEHKRDSRWWIQTISGVVYVALGAILTAFAS